MIIEALKEAQKGKSVSEQMAHDTFKEIMNGEVADPVLIGALLTAISMNGVNVTELTGAARAMRSAGIKIKAPADAVDIVGTGGDGFGTFNCSTTAAIIAAGAGAIIAKHGNKASTSKSGSADCLAALGYNLMNSIETVEKSIAENGIGFLFANRCHPAMMYAAPVRKALPYRTIFNLLGPLTNPAGVRRCALGVYAPEVIDLYIGALKGLGADHAIVFCGEVEKEDGSRAYIDEISVSGKTLVAELTADGEVKRYEFDPHKLLGVRYSISAIAGGTPEVNAALTLAVLKGEEHGAYRLASCLNAAAALVAADQAKDLVEGMMKAAEAIDSGKAMQKLEALVWVGEK